MYWGGITPTTVNPRLSRRTVRPMASFRPPKRACHIAWLMRTAALASPARRSSLVNARPSAGATPSVSAASSFV